MKLDDATLVQVRALRDELLNPAIEQQRMAEIIRIIAMLRPGLIERVILDHDEYRRNRKRLLQVLPMQTTPAA